MFKIYLFKIMAYIFASAGGDALFCKIARKYAKDELIKIKKEYKTILVTGSCGKTTTLAQVEAVLKKSGARVIFGGEKKNGDSVITQLFKSYKKVTGEGFMVFETEPDCLYKVTKKIKPHIIAVTNIYGDKKPEEDTYGELEKACESLSDTMFVLNGDEPVLYDFMKDKARRYFYGFRVNPNFQDIPITTGKICTKCNNEYKYIYNTQAHLGSYSCDTCGKTRPQLALGVDTVPVWDEKGALVSFDGIKMNIPLPGGSNIYNALCAATLGAAAGVVPEDIKDGIEGLKSIPAVCERVRVNTKEVKLLLANDALQCSEVINSITPDTSAVFVACYLGGKDLSWIDTVPFEKLINLNYHGILVGGEGYKEMYERLERAGLDSAKFTVCEDFDTFIYAVRTNVCGRLYVLATKKEMKQLRKNLHKKGYIKRY